MNVIKHTFDFTGTASRREYWVFFVVASGILGAMFFAELKLGNPASPIRLTYVAAGLLYLPWASLTVRRLHDTGRSGWWLFLNLVPYLGNLILLYFMVSKSSLDKKSPWGPSSLHVLGLVALGMIAVLLASRALWAPYWIPSSSMKPTLLVGDYIVVTRPFSPKVERGDVLVFRHPVNGEDFIFRVTGLPGDNIQVNNGEVEIDGVALQQEPKGMFEEIFERQGPIGGFPQCQSNGVGLGGLCEKELFEETLPNGVTHSILNIGERRLDSTPVYTVPEGHYFFMGDNRDNSTDSRVAQSASGVGFVPYENLIGRADRIVFSSAGRSMFAFWTWRSDRFFKAVN